MAKRLRSGAYWSKRQLVRVTGLSLATLGRRIRQGTFPSATLAPTGTKMGWAKDDVHAWLRTAK